MIACAQAPATETFHVAGTRIAARRAGDPSKPALLLIHGLPNASGYFRHVMPALAEVAYVVAPDLPGFGASDPLDVTSFARFADAVHALLAQLGVDSFHLYLHDFGAPVGFDLAMREPQRIRSLLVQNANAHKAGHGPSWADTIEYWRHPTPANERKATTHLSAEGTRAQYFDGAPPEIAARIDPTCWEEDWRVMSLPGRLAMQRDLLLDYGDYVARYDEIAAYLRAHQPPALLLWGRHDVYFDIAETVAWMQALPRMEAHVLDGPHLLLETHAEDCAALMTRFLAQRPDR